MNLSLRTMLAAGVLASGLMLVADAAHASFTTRSSNAPSSSPATARATGSSCALARASSRRAPAAGGSRADGSRRSATGCGRGAGDDRFSWQPGDGSDEIDGGAGVDASAFTGSGAAEGFRLGGAGSRARLTRDVGGIAASLAAIERVDVAAAGGGDTLTVDDQSTTALRAVGADLGGADGASDRVVVNGSATSDAIRATDDTVTGLVAAGSLDQMVAHGHAGPDVIDVAPIGGTLTNVRVLGLPGNGR